ncbi:MAG: formyl-CoA transferase [Pseudonocardia sp.]|jgi:crotonobetainyl-CoA:carnitine CoA-transferase CaiB-like acyl-CoA transferase|uniref:CaiB/BaiF CoA transferase family protein n=1 Tax=Pseudonocardia sp. TaxID=60912 RepID=UPI00262EC908|nr:CaiB/BaiF CoA-transferase family protein [Pseudonocardia sp.]MCU1626147.1 formyl-CoA transferase [Pseudonocardia sp.]HEV7470524.1 CaiB/BaiF CoA-transferase family protein [Pseudonocardia sp.]
MSTSTESAARTDGPGPLAGVTVVALEQAVSAPLCTRTLADLGARVIKVENPRGGDFARHYDDVVHGLAAHFVWCNRGKESVTLDLKSDAGRDLLHRLLAEADVLVSNLAPGATERIGVGAAQMAERHPHVVALEISGYGTGGPLSAKRAYDMLVQGESGACSITGLPGAPAKPGPPFADASTGLYAAIAILGALYERGKVRSADGGGRVAVSMFDTMAELMGYPLTYTRHSGVEQQPVGMGSPAVVPYGAYPTADGQTVILGTTNDAEWQRLARDMMGRPDLADDERYRRGPDRVVHRATLDAELAAWCRTLPLAELQAKADTAGIGNARFNTPAEVVEHPHLTARDRWREVETPGGPIPALLPPPVYEGRELGMGPVPGLGEHTDTVLSGIGLTPGEIMDLRDRKVL